MSGRWKKKDEQNCDRALLVGLLEGDVEHPHDLEGREARLFESRAAAEGMA